MVDSEQKSEEESISIPVIEERINYKVHQFETGKLRVSKQVYEETIDVDETVTYETAHVERVPINQYVDTLPLPVRQEGDVMIIPVLKEVLVKRTLLVEELHITKTTETVHEQRPVTLRKETVQIHRDQDPQ